MDEEKLTTLLEGISKELRVNRVVFSNLLVNIEKKLDIISDKLL